MFQLRICSAHFEGGEKKEGDIPVPDPTVGILEVALGYNLHSFQDLSFEQRFKKTETEKKSCWLPIDCILLNEFKMRPLGLFGAGPQWEMGS